jgi:transposase
LAKLLKAGMLPTACIEPKDTRPIRDLRRQRSRLVALRGAEDASRRRLLRRHGLLGHSRTDIKEATEEALQRWFAQPLVRLHGEHERQRIELSTQQLDTLASPLLATVQARPEVHRLLTIPGLGKILALPIVAEIGALARWRQAREFASSGRLVPGVAPSGPVRRRGRHAKPGSPPLTWAFSHAARSAVRYSPKSRRCFDRHLGRHRGKGGKLIASDLIAPQRAQAAYHVLRDGTVDREERLFQA